MGEPRGQFWQKIGTDAVGEPRYPGRFPLGEARKTVEQTRRPERLSTRPSVATLEADQAHHGRETAVFRPRGAVRGDWVALVGRSHGAQEWLSQQPANR